MLCNICACLCVGKSVMVVKISEAEEIGNGIQLMIGKFFNLYCGLPVASLLLSEQSRSIPLRIPESPWYPAVLYHVLLYSNRGNSQVPDVSGCNIHLPPLHHVQ